MKIDALKINGTDSFAIRPDMLNNYILLINGEQFTSDLKRELIIFLKEDCLQCQQKGKKLIDYRRGDERMSIECYRSKPQHYGDENSDEDTLRAIANRKELTGFAAHYEPYKPEDVTLDIIGSIGDTGSTFIYSSIMGKYSKTPAIYTVNTTQITLHEYELLAKKYESHARFQTPDRPYLSYVKINNNFVFTRIHLFSDSQKNEVCINLSEAKAREKEIRQSVKSMVHRVVFRKECSSEKLQTLKSSLIIIRKSKKMKTKDEMIEVLIKEINEYISETNK